MLLLNLGSRGLRRIPLFSSSLRSVARMASTAAWGYTKENGPSTWVKNLGIEIGQRQSPIDIIKGQCTFDPSLSSLKFTYPDYENAKLVNNGATVMFSPTPDSGPATVSAGPVSNQYQLAQFHFHWGENDGKGSEHTVDGESYSGELHLVHWNTDLYKSVKDALTAKNGLMVFGIFLKVGQEDHSGLRTITDNLPSIKKPDSSVVLKGPFNPSCLLPDSLEYWSYPGSLTTPPLSESVTWVVFKKPIVVSGAQVAAFRELNSGDGGKLCQNFRPPCPLNEREVKASFS